MSRPASPRPPRLDAGRQRQRELTLIDGALWLEDLVIHSPHYLRNDPGLDAAVISLTHYSAGQALGRQLREAGAAGIVYPSVRDPSGECLAAFKTTLLRDCLHAAYLE